MTRVVVTVTILEHLQGVIDLRSIISKLNQHRKIIIVTVVVFFILPFFTTKQTIFVFFIAPLFFIYFLGYLIKQIKGVPIWLKSKRDFYKNEFRTINELVNLRKGSNKKMEKKVITVIIASALFMVDPISAFADSGGPVVHPSSTEHLRKIVTGDGYRQEQRVTNPIKVIINDVSYTPRDIDPMMIEGRVFLPLRFISEQLGYSYSWYEENLRAEIDDGKLVVDLYTYTMYKYDGLTIPTDTPPFLFEGTPMIGARQIAAALNYKITWDSKQNAVVFERAKPNNSLQQSNVFNRSK